MSLGLLLGTRARHGHVTSRPRRALVPKSKPSIFLQSEPIRKGKGAYSRGPNQSEKGGEHPVGTTCVARGVRPAECA
eukprot:2117503-Pyramimonas_sp.AAC.2